MKALAGIVAIVLAGAAASVAAQSWPAVQSGFGTAGDARKGRAAHQKGDAPREVVPRRAADDPGRPHGRLSEEERKQLHRDLDRANRELYRQRPGRNQ